MSGHYEVRVFGIDPGTREPQVLAHFCVPDRNCFMWHPSWPVEVIFAGIDIIYREPGEAVPDQMIAMAPSWN